MDEILTMAYKTPSWADLSSYYLSTSFPSIYSFNPATLVLWATNYPLASGKTVLVIPLAWIIFIPDIHISFFHFTQDSATNIISSEKWSPDHFWCLLFLALTYYVMLYHIILCNTILYYIIVYCLFLYWYISPTGVGTWSLSFVAISPAFWLNPLIVDVFSGFMTHPWTYLETRTSFQLRKHLIQLGWWDNPGFRENHVSTKRYSAWSWGIRRSDKEAQKFQLTGVKLLAESYRQNIFNKKLRSEPKGFRTCHFKICILAYQLFWAEGTCQKGSLSCPLWHENRL